jgi:hypothetical protein
MEYSESIIDGGCTTKLVCANCDSKHHQVKGVIKYAFIFFEYLPFYQVNKLLVITCSHCESNFDINSLSKRLTKAITQPLFTARRQLYTFSGCLLMIAFLAYLLFAHFQREALSDKIIASPQINDFYFLDFRKLSTELRPHEKYRLAKVVDITDSIVSLQYGQFFYHLQSSAQGSFSNGRVKSFSYFAKKRHEFSFEQIIKMRTENIIYQAIRPEGILLYGNQVTGYQRAPRIGGAYFPGARQNQQGFAFLQATYLDDHFKSAFMMFTRSAELGYRYGQVNLAEMYLAGNAGQRDVDKALYWLKNAALQSFKPAIEKYIIVCNKHKKCHIDSFYQELTEQGVNFHLNYQKLGN